MTVARITEISSISTKSFEDAIVQGVDRALRGEGLAYAVIAVVALVGTQWALVVGIQSAQGSLTK